MGWSLKAAVRLAVGQHQRQAHGPPNGAHPQELLAHWLLLLHDEPVHFFDAATQPHGGGQHFVDVHCVPVEQGELLGSLGVIQMPATHVLPLPHWLELVHCTQSPLVQWVDAHIPSVVQTPPLGNLETQLGKMQNSLEAQLSELMQSAQIPLWQIPDAQVPAPNGHGVLVGSFATHPTPPNTQN